MEFKVGVPTVLSQGWPKEHRQLRFFPHLKTPFFDFIGTVAVHPVLQHSIISRWNEVLARFGDLPLNHAPCFPCYDGAMEKVIRDF
jgi:hypothetical protein